MSPSSLPSASNPHRSAPPSRASGAFGAALRFGAAAMMLALGGLVAAAPGCSGATDEYRCDATGCFQCDGYGCKQVPTPTIKPCAFAGDTACADGSVCTELGCLTPCKDDAGCEKGLVCKASLCTPPTIESVKPLVCGAASDCAKVGAGALCVDGKCVAAPPCEGLSCTCKYSSDCGDGRVCVDSKCAEACDPSKPCAAGFDCGDKGYCVPGKPTCGAAAGGAACKTGERCVDGRCSAGCASDDQCLGADGKADPQLRCVGGACIPDTRTDTKCSADAQCVNPKNPQKCVDGFCKYTCASDANCLGIDSRIGVCSPTEKICRSAEDLAAKCTSKVDCAEGKSCVDGQCK